MADACPFCTLPPERILAAHGPVVVVADGFPVSPGHSLVIPRRHIASLWEASPEERTAVWAALDARRATLDRTLDPPPDGYNVGAA